MAIVLLLALMFPLTGRWWNEANADAVATGVAAWRLAEEQTLDLSRYEGQVMWLAPDKKGRLVSDRPPGLIALAIPAYVLWPQDQYSNGPATLTALVFTLAGVLILWWILVPLTNPRFAVLAALVFALGTTTWAVSSAQLWPHGPGQFFALLSMLIWSRRQSAVAGLSAAAAILIRPVSIVWVGLVSLFEARRMGSLRPLMNIGLTGAAGLAMVFAYNWWQFDRFGARSGYSGVTGGFGGYTGVRYLENLFDMLVSPQHGFLLLSPVVTVAVVGVIRFRRDIPAWAVSFAAAALGYLLVHAYLNRASGGMELFYRYPLEALALASPLLAVGAFRTFQGGGMGRWILVGAAVSSVIVQLVNVFYLNCELSTPNLPACFLA